MDSCIYYQQAQDYRSALEWALQAELSAKSEYGELDTNYISTLNRIGEIYYYLGKIDSSEKYFEINLKICRKLFQRR